jgi:hypothetical protein
MNINYVTGFNLDNETIESRLSDFIDNLPHGGGINYTWSANKPARGEYVYFSNGYEVMAESGYYIGTQQFTIRFPSRLFHDAIFNLSYAQIKVDLYHALIQQFDIQFNGNRHLGEYYQLKEYLVDTIAYSLAEYFGRHLDANKEKMLFA